MKTHLLRELLIVEASLSIPWVEAFKLPNILPRQEDFVLVDSLDEERKRNDPTELNVLMSERPVDVFPFIS